MSHEILSPAQRDLKKAVEAFDRNAPRNPVQKDLRKVEKFLPHPKIQYLMRKVMEGK